MPTSKGITWVTLNNGGCFRISDKECTVSSVIQYITAIDLSLIHIFQGNSGGTITDIDGRYTLEEVDADATLVFSYIGYVPQKIVRCV